MKQATFDETDVHLKIKGKLVVGEYIEVYLESTQKNVRADCEWILIDPLYKNSALNILEEHGKIFESSGKHLF
jgi:hypothetical protein